MRNLLTVGLGFAGYRKVRKSRVELHLASPLRVGAVISIPSVDYYGLGPQLFDDGEVARRSIGPTYDSLFRWTGG